MDMYGGRIRYAPKIVNVIACSTGRVRNRYNAASGHAKSTKYANQFGVIDRDHYEIRGASIASTDISG
jgi:hypothetical protein